MPRPRPRPAPCDCLECREPASASSAPGLADAAARQDPPPKLLLIFADGFLQALQAESASLVHLDAHVREGSLGMLAVREGPLGRGGAPSSTEGLVELAQLFGLQDAEPCGAGEATAEPATALSLPQRFMDLAVEFLSHCGPACKLAERAGCHKSGLLAPCQQADEHALLLPTPASTAAAAAHSLNLQGWLAEAAAKRDGAPAAAAPWQATQDDDLHGPADAVILHVSLAAASPGLQRAERSAGMAPAAGPLQGSQRTIGEPPSSGCSNSEQQTRMEDGAALRSAMAAGGAAAGRAQGLCGERGTQWPAHPREETAAASGQDSSDAHFGAEALRWLDAVVREVGALPGARQGLLLVLVLGSAGQPSLALPVKGGGPLGGLCAADAGAFAGVSRPRQSYELATGAAVTVTPHAGLLVAQRLSGVVRRDEAAQLSAAEAVARGGGGCILLERLLPELAYKLGRAPKYGA